MQVNGEYARSNNICLVTGTKIMVAIIIIEMKNMKINLERAKIKICD